MKVVFMKGERGSETIGTAFYFFGGIILLYIVPLTSKPYIFFVSTILFKQSAHNVEQFVGDGLLTRFVVKQR